MKGKLILNAKRFIVMVTDTVSMFFAYWLSFTLRFNFSIPDIHLKIFFTTLPVIVVIRSLCFYFFGLYAGVWRYASMNDLLRILKATFLSSFIILYVYVDFCII